ncbi:uncharacterized protein EAF01_011328 [Botrytis porri]|uniref:uncharacterized protein n=1 Tax=Botrytis porri TaxID=87229 RepID=UPI00190031E4|nr:uncharacterized protein EAF01_011328 [Botrytis porri]KAF7885263.1 hypothetical protein EAF01_011328 [Botrytis porri]
MDQDDQISNNQEIDFCTLGMFIIDEIHYLPPTPSVYDVLGGAGSYSALGARLFSPPPLSKTISWIVDKGSDFPPSISSQISTWQTSCLIRTDPTRLTTRGWNGYDSNETRSFKYTTPKLRLDETSIASHPPLLFAKSFHLICSPNRCIDLVTRILSLRKSHSPNHPKPLFIWEPVPDLCTPDELLNCTNVLPYIDVLSPNHSELAGFMGDPDSGMTPEGEISTEAVERSCEQLLSSMPLQSYAIVVRCGALGCYVAKNGGRNRRAEKNRRKRPANRSRGGLTLDMNMEDLFAGLLSDSGEISFERNDYVPVDPGIEKWIPAYHQAGEGEEEHKVVDPTGGGNAFLGGLAVGLARGKGIIEASCWGSVAASFAIEQVGVPKLGVLEELEGTEGEEDDWVEEGEGEEEEDDTREMETWNGVVVQERLREFMARVDIAPSECPSR